MDSKKAGKGIMGSRVFLFVIVFVLFKIFIWDEYIVNSSAGAALEEVEGESGVGQTVSKDRVLAIRKVEEGFKVYAVSKGFWGWSITDELFVGTDEPLKVIKQTLHFKQGQKMYASMVVDRELKLDKVIAGSVGFDRLVGDKAMLYYHFSDKPLEDEYEGTRTDGVKVELR